MLQVVLVAAVTFGVLFLVDKYFTATFRGKLWCLICSYRIQS